jgi:hypothetical protein
MNAALSNIFVIFYVTSSLLLRWWIEPQLNGNIWISAGMGLLALLFLWALIRSKLIRPSLLNLDILINGKKDSSGQ